MEIGNGGLGSLYGFECPTCRAARPSIEKDVLQDLDSKGREDVHRLQAVNP